MATDISTSGITNEADKLYFLEADYGGKIIRYFLFTQGQGQFTFQFNKPNGASTTIKQEYQVTEEEWPIKTGKLLPSFSGIHGGCSCFHYGKVTKIAELFRTDQAQFKDCELFDRLN